MKEQAPFQLDVLLDAKAVVAEADAGDGLWIEGWASDFEVDRQDEAFMPNAFSKAINQYLKNPVLLYHHMADKAVGQVKDLKLAPDKGLYVKAWLDKPADGTEDANIYNKVKSGTIRAFSVGGVFRRKQTPMGPRIHEVDLREISITPLPVNPRSLFAVAGKAFGTEPDLAAHLDALTELVEAQDELAGKAVSAEKRRNAKYHFPGDDSFPIDNRTDLRHAISRSGSSKHPVSEVRKYIISVAKKLDAMDMIPEDWLQ